MGDTLAQLIGFQLLKTGDKILTNKPVNIVVAKNGTFEVRDTPIGRVSVKTAECPGLEDVKEGLTLTLPKIPVTLLYQIQDLFCKVYEKYKTEAMAHIYYDKANRRYFVDIPEQEVSGAAVDYKHNLELEKKYILVMDIHSHHTMGNFFSGTDNGDEKGDRLYGVIGKLDKGGEISIRAGAGKNKIELSVTDVFDTPKMNKDWMKNIKEKQWPNFGGARAFGDDREYGPDYLWWEKDVYGRPIQENKKLVSETKFKTPKFFWAELGFDNEQGFDTYLLERGWASVDAFADFYYAQTPATKDLIVLDIKTGGY